MNKIKKFQLGGTSLANPINLLTNFTLPPPKIPYSYYAATNTPINYPYNTSLLNEKQTHKVSTTGISLGINVLGDYLSKLLSDKVFGDSEVGLNVGSVFGSALGSTTNTLGNNILKGTTLLEGLGRNVGASVGGALSGIAGNYIGKGISASFGNSAVGKGIGAGVGTAIGGIGGMGLQSLSQGKGFFDTFNVVKNAKAASDAAKAAGKSAAAAAAASKFSSFANLGGLAGSAIGAGLLAGFGPSKVYGGKYGNIAQVADTVYDTAQTAVGFMGPVGSLVSGAMALNKGLTNAFGSTDGMTVLDAILGSAWMPFFVNWINMIGANTTGTFNKLSWRGIEKVNSFMGNAFGDLGERFDRAREEAGKTYGLFSLGAYEDALNNLNFANKAWEKVLNMADLNILQNVRSLDMSSINNLRYAQKILGGWSPLTIGKQGMKILNNATNHKIGMRLLSGAALVDSKQMILCSAVD